MFSSLQQQFTSFWKKQSLGKQITLASLILAALILTPVLVSWANRPSYAVAYTGLSEADAAQIVQKLDENNTPYQLKNSGTIEVPSDQVYTVRLLMAREGLPQSSTVGYELFSGTSMLGMTEFSQQVNYQRAVEGELQRTIGSLDAVQSVRVHLVIPEKTLLTSDQGLSTASVTIQVKPGHALDGDQVRSITHLVASSVEGLKPESVVVVDTAGNMLADGTGTESAMDLSQKDDQRAAEQAYAIEVQKRVQTILDKILGPNRSAVQASVEMDWTQREITSNSYEPTAVAIRSSQKINETSIEGGTNGGVPGAASNLPTPVATTTGAEGTSYERSEETLNYEVSQIQSHEIIAPGKVNRLSVSVMVDGISDPDQIDIIRSAVEAAAGIDAKRGDQIVVESFDFDSTALDTLNAELAQQQKQQQYMQIGLAAGAVLILLVLFFFILRMINNVRNASKEAWRPVLRPVGEVAALMDDGYKVPALQLQNDLSNALNRLAEKNEPPAAPKTENEDVVVQLRSRTQSTTATAPEDEQRARVISRLTEENPATVAEIIQLWLNEGKKS
ncbi:MAG: flagellar basal-body MS-ring/collar protein FliF [Anaerolineales bacterium]